MTAIMTRLERPGIATPRRIRIDAPVTHSEISPDSLYLRRWAARQAAGYRNLLLTITAATKTVRED